MRDYRHIDRYLDKLVDEIYQEPASHHHVQAAINVVQNFCSDLQFESVVELGCGTAPILNEMKKYGKITLGITLGKEKMDHPLIEADMNFSGLETYSYDLVVTRHALEHSPMPLLLLMEMERISKKYALIIVPVPSERMIRWPNHYSVFPRENWGYLFDIAGWKINKFNEEKLFCYDHEKKLWDWEYQYLLEKR